MKKNTLGKVLMVVIIIAICLVSFVGIYVKKQGRMTNVLPEYSLAMNVSGSRVIKLKLDESTKTTVYDSEGKETTEGKNEDGTLKEGYRQEEKKVNLEEARNKENYQRVKAIYEARLKHLGMGEYEVRANEETGEIQIEIPENLSTDEVVANLIYQGKFEIIDSDTKEVLMNNEHIKKANTVYSDSSSGRTVYLSIEFNKEGKAKFEEITKQYIKTKDEDGNEVTKKIHIDIDGEKIIETYFEEPITTGLLQLSIGKATTSSTDLNSYFKQAANIASLLDSGVMPLKYEVSANNYRLAPESGLDLKIVGIALAVILAGIVIYFIIRYRMNGLLAAISYVGLAAVILLVVRYANVIVSFESIVPMITIMIADLFMLQYVLKQYQDADNVLQEIMKNTMLRYISILFPLAIIAVVFTFIEWIPIASIGMILFWGLVSLFIYNYFVIRFLLSTSSKKKE